MASQAGRSSLLRLRMRVTSLRCASGRLRGPWRGSQAGDGQRRRLVRCDLERLAVVGQAQGVVAGSKAVRRLVSPDAHAKMPSSVDDAEGEMGELLRQARRERELTAAVA